MKTRILLLSIFMTCALLLGSSPAWSIEYPPNMPGGRSEVYRSTDEAELRIWIFEPTGHQATQQRPAIVFFFGGGWKAGSPEQFLRWRRENERIVQIGPFYY